MRVFNEEAVKSEAEIILLFKRSEVKTIIEVLKYAYETRPLKKSWGKLLILLEEKAGIY